MKIEMKRVHGYELASKGDRLVAAIVRSIIILMAFILIYTVLGTPISEVLNSDADLTDMLFGIIQSLILGAIFYPLFIGNIGHKIFGLKVISVENGEDFKKYDEGALREALKNLSGYLIIPNIWILWDEKNQNLYDKLTKTYVVKKH
ncbi:RDD family protein [Salegentibacter sp. LM13S]|uniref:RDD family protein n=1 Tax=Salegentibacter lacus TaxID=2873599 RepID=UPI001CC9C7AD|nr:RDD family protein [Salegentibacter lacus]MBZ9631827.1 RDD family protein [Salegentibacter lacus]